MLLEYSNVAATLLQYSMLWDVTQVELKKLRSVVPNQKLMFQIYNDADLKGEIHILVW